MLPKALKLLLLAGAATLSFSPAYAQSSHGDHGGNYNGGHDGYRGGGYGGGGDHQGSYGGTYNGGHDGYRGGGNYQDGHGQYYAQPRRSHMSRHRDQVYYNTYDPHYGGYNGGYDPYYGGYNSYPRSYSGGFLGIRIGGGSGHHRSHHRHH